MAYQTVILNPALTIAGFYDAVETLDAATQEAGEKQTETFAVIFHNTIPVKVSFPYGMDLYNIGETSFSVPRFVYASTLFDTDTGGSGGGNTGFPPSYALLIRLESPPSIAYNEVIAYTDGIQGEVSTGTFVLPGSGEVWKRIALPNVGDDTDRLITVVFKNNGSQVGNTSFIGDYTAIDGIYPIYVYCNANPRVYITVSESGRRDL